MEHTTLAAADLGSNSFHLAIGRVVDDQIYPLDSMKETVRLATGLTADKNLDEKAQERALGALRRFSERLAGMPREAVRIVGTNALRVARNSAAFLRRAEQTLGFPIEVIPGREEARLIYLGVVHSLPLAEHNRLVVDIGGGSTEFIIGHKLRTRAVESLYMGCVSYTGRFFTDGRIDKKALRQAELAAREQVQSIAARYEREGWQEAVGSSGTARSIAEILQKNGLSDGHITADGLEWLREHLIEAGDLKRLATMAGLREDRVPVVTGGVAIMSAVFRELGLKEMTVASGALRDGVLWDLLGRVHHRDIREVTVEQFEKRYHVDPAQAERVARLAQSLLASLDRDGKLAPLADFLKWGARLHEIGISIAQGAYHKHSAYILANADMPGFSRQEQQRLAAVVLAQRGKLAKMRAAFEEDPELAALAFCLRTAVIFHRSRRDVPDPALAASRKPRAFRIEVPREWLERQTLVALALEEDKQQWSCVGWELEVSETS
jgi:exopolyphosphatase / guanosine-5'-triphosphate,3'-diphosphate pyrophosphatase